MYHYHQRKWKKKNLGWNCFQKNMLKSLIFRYVKIFDVQSFSPCHKPRALRVRMCSTNQAHLQCKQGRAVQIRHIFSTSKDVWYELGTSSVQTRMCSTNQSHHQYKQGRTVRIRHIFSTSQDVQYKSDTSSVPARM